MMTPIPANSPNGVCVLQQENCWTGAGASGKAIPIETEQEDLLGRTLSGTRKNHYITRQHLNTRRSCIKKCILFTIKIIILKKRVHKFSVCFYDNRSAKRSGST